MYPDDLRYTKDHEWIKLEKGVGTVGITSYAQEALGDIVFIELPSVGDSVSAGDVLGSIESVKAVSDLYTPVSGEIKEVNSALENGPELINSDPYGDGWILKIAGVDKGELEELMNAEEYQDFLKEVED
jgi:glycine cleavage system H protein